MSAPRVYVDAVGVAAPGLVGWAAAREVLSGRAAWVHAELPRHSPETLPRNERRRATPPVRLSFQCAEDALSGAAVDAASLATVFASSDSDLEMVHKINVALAREGHAVSPTDFHNSVHNAPAGYWSIAVGARGPSASVAAHDATFAAGLLESVALVAGDGVDCLFAAYDTVPPPPLDAHRATTEPFGVALLLRAERSEASLAALSLSLGDAEEAVMEDAGLETLRTSNPAARALPVLRMLARGEPGTVAVPAVAGTLAVTLAAP